MLRKLFNWIHFALIFYVSTPVLVHAKDGAILSDKAIVTNGLVLFLMEYQVVIGGILGFGMLTGLLAFIVLLMRLSATGDQPQARAEILKEMLAVGVTTAVIGSFGTFMLLYFQIMA